jgi:hypothetical protein
LLIAGVPHIHQMNSARMPQKTLKLLQKEKNILKRRSYPINFDVDELKCHCMHMIPFFSVSSLKHNPSSSSATSCF